MYKFSQLDLMMTINYTKTKVRIKNKLQNMKKKNVTKILIYEEKLSLYNPRGWSVSLVEYVGQVMSDKL